MIKVFPIEKEESSIKTIKLVEKANKISNNIISHFYELLGYDPELFKHLYNIEIIIDYGNIVKKEELAHYESKIDNNHNKNRIIINGESIENIDSIDELVVTIIHEKLHANRDVLLKREVNYLNIADYIDFNSLTLKEKELYQELVNLLENKKLNKKYRVLKITNYKNYSFIYIYNKDKRSFELYKLNNLIINYKNINKSYNEIIKYIIDNNIKPIKTIYNYNHFKDYEMYEKTNIYSPNNSFNNKEEVNKADFIIEYQEQLEEALIETLAILMHYHREKDTLDIDEFCTKAFYKWNDPLLLRAVKIISKLKIEFIEEFLLSSYQDEYNDVLEKIFLEDYIRIIKAFDNIYEFDLDSKRSIYDEFIVDEIISRRLK